MTQQVQGRPARSGWVLAAAILGSGIVFLDGTIVSIALPRMGRELPATVLGVLEGQAYITSGYLAVLAALLILAGALADRYGRRRIFAIGLFMFGVVSALCGLAQTMEQEVIFRLMQGAAGALLVPGSLAIISASFTGTERGRAFGVWASATSGLVILGPVIGGILVDTLSWRIAFLVNVPLVALALFATLRYVPESRSGQSRRLDWLGSVVIAIAVGGISFGLIRGQQAEWRDSVAFAALGLGVVAAVLLPLLMLKRRDPLIPPDLFRRRNFTVINLSTFLIYGALYVTQSFQSLFIQGVLGYTALGAALVGLPAGLLLTFGSTRAGTVAARLGPRRFLVAGPIIMAVGQLWWVRVPADSQAWMIDIGRPETWIPPLSTFVDVLPAIILFGIGITLVVAPLTTTLMNSVPTENSGLGSAINNSISRIGQPLIMAVLFIAITATFYSAIHTRVPSLNTDAPDVRARIQPLNPVDPSLPPDEQTAIRQASTDAYHLAMIVCALLLLGGAGVNAFGLREDELAGGDAGAAEGSGAGAAA
jgi:EmrB/QacA subfamily drug resistance transporter